jgi:hypothetical protein
MGMKKLLLAVMVMCSSSFAVAEVGLFDGDPQVMNPVVENKPEPVKPQPAAPGVPAVSLAMQKEIQEIFECKKYPWEASPEVDEMLQRFFLVSYHSKDKVALPVEALGFDLFVYGFKVIAFAALVDMGDAHQLASVLEEDAAAVAQKLKAKKSKYGYVKKISSKQMNDDFVVMNGVYKGYWRNGGKSMLLCGAWAEFYQK